MKKSLIASLCFLLCLARFDPATAASQRNDRYSLSQHIANGHTTLRLFNRANGRTVWRKQIAELDCIGWSRDHTALAVSAMVLGKTPFRLLLWQKGRPLRLLDDSPMSEGGYIDGVIDIVWSPDNRRVLYRVYQSGSKMLNVGDLYCVNVRTGRASFIAHGVRQMRWLGPRRIGYHVVKLEIHGSRERLVEDIHSRFSTLP